MPSGEDKGKRRGGCKCCTRASSCQPQCSERLEEIQKNNYFIFFLLVKTYPLTYFCFENNYYS